MALKILYERIGLGAEATEEQALERIHSLADENKELRERSDNLQKILAENHKNVEDAKAAKKKYQLQEGEIFIDAAIRDQKIDKDDREFYLHDWERDSERVRKQIEKKGYRAVLAKQMSLAGDAVAPIDAIGEARARVAEMIANDTSKKLNEVEAYKRLWREDPDLWKRHTEARESRANPKGGDR